MESSALKFYLLCVFAHFLTVQGFVSSINDVNISKQSPIIGGTYWFGSQLASKDGKLIPGNNMEGAAPRKRVKVKSFLMDKDTVSNLQFSQFVRDTSYVTEAEKYGWSFVFEPLLLANNPDVEEEISERDLSESSSKLQKSKKSKNKKVKKQKVKSKPNRIMQGIIDQTDDKEIGMGRVQKSPHWMAVRGANWYFPLGQIISLPEPDRAHDTGEVSASSVYYTVAESNEINMGITIEALDLLEYPVVHVSHSDAKAYCKWAGLIEQTLEEEEQMKVGAGGDVNVNGEMETGRSESDRLSRSGSGKKRIRRLPTEVEWEYGARSGLVNQSYPWGEDMSQMSPMNIWELNRQNPAGKGVGGLPGEVGVTSASLSAMKQFPSLSSNTLHDGYLGVAPTYSYKPNAYGLYNMLGNVWEWVGGGSDTKKERPLRGGSFIDSPDGSFNHIVLVSTRQTNSPDSSASNVGFRCARSAE